MLRECLNKRRRLDIKNCSSREKRWLYCTDDANDEWRRVQRGWDGTGRAERAQRRSYATGITCQLCAGLPKKNRNKKKRTSRSKSGNPPSDLQILHGDLWFLSVEAHFSTRTRNTSPRRHIDHEISYSRCVILAIYFFLSSLFHLDTVWFIISNPDLPDLVSETFDTDLFAFHWDANISSRERRSLHFEIIPERFCQFQYTRKTIFKKYLGKMEKILCCKRRKVIRRKKLTHQKLSSKKEFYSKNKKDIPFSEE